MIYYTYVIKSLKDGSLYKGHCEDLQRRLKQHNAGETQSIRSKTPFEIIYTEEFSTSEDAISRKKYFKSAAGRKFLKSKLIL